jgi:2-dehydropantoate 2-reductase
MRIVIVGPGALGTIFAAALVRAGNNVSLFGRHSPWLQSIQADGLRLQARDGTIVRLPAAITDDPSIVATADAVIMLVKATDTLSAVDAITPYLASDVPVLTLQNGLGNSRIISEGLGGGHRVLPGTTAQAGRRIEPNLVIHTGEGPTLIGYEYSDDAALADKLSRVMTESGIPAAAVPDIERWIWHKAAVNAAINGLTALGGFPNGEIVAQPDLFDAAESIAEEAATVARALGIELGSMRGSIRETATATATNRSSMLQDLEAGRQTEVDAIHGAIVEAGARVGIATPIISLLASLIRAKAQRRDGSMEEHFGG